MFEAIVEGMLAVATVVTMVAALGLEPDAREANPCGDGVKTAEVCEELLAQAGEVSRVRTDGQHGKQRKRAAGS